MTPCVMHPKTHAEKSKILNYLAIYTLQSLLQTFAFFRGFLHADAVCVRAKRYLPFCNSAVSRRYKRRVLRRANLVGKVRNGL